MGQEYQIFEVLFFAVIAAFILFRLRSVLGRRTGHERPRRDPFAAREGLSSPQNTPADEKAAAGPEANTPGSDDDVDQGLEAVAPAGSRLNQTLTEIQIADRNFDIEQFLAGARGAYELIVKAFAAGDKEALQPLLDEEVFASFCEVIDGREARGETVDFEFVGIREAKITDASLEGRTAELTVSFESQIIQAVKSGSGDLIAGDPDTVVTVIDVWSFARDVKSKKPDWLLVGTGAGA